MPKYTKSVDPIDNALAKRKVELGSAVSCSISAMHNAATYLADAAVYADTEQLTALRNAIDGQNILRIQLETIFGPSIDSWKEVKDNY